MKTMKEVINICWVLVPESVAVLALQMLIISLHQTIDLQL